jgi:hypothetical protein
MKHYQRIADKLVADHLLAHDHFTMYAQINDEMVRHYGESILEQSNILARRTTYNAVIEALNKYAQDSETDVSISQENQEHEVVIPSVELNKFLEAHNAQLDDNDTEIVEGFVANGTDVHNILEIVRDIGDSTSVLVRLLKKRPREDFDTDEMEEKEKRIRETFIIEGTGFKNHRDWYNLAFKLGDLIELFDPSVHERFTHLVVPDVDYGTLDMSVLAGMAFNAKIVTVDWLIDFVSDMDAPRDPSHYYTKLFNTITRPFLKDKEIALNKSVLIASFNGNEDDYKMFELTVEALGGVIAQPLQRIDIYITTVRVGHVSEAKQVKREWLVDCIQKNECLALSEKYKAQ